MDEKAAWRKAEKQKMLPYSIEMIPDEPPEETASLFPTNQPCDRCGEELWVFVSLSPNAKSATWKCSYCGRATIINGAIRHSKGENVRAAIPKEVQREVWRRDRAKCVECGSSEKLEYDHIIPRSKGGSDTTRNIQLLCESCNRKKSSKIG